MPSVCAPPIADTAGLARFARGSSRRCSTAPAASTTTCARARGVDVARETIQYLTRLHNRTDLYRRIQVFYTCS